MSRINRLRPSHLLAVFNNHGLTNTFTSVIPDGDIGSTTMLEKMLIVVLGRLVEADSVFEFGTFKGETTKLLLTNKVGQHVASLDLAYFEGEVTREDFDLSTDVQNDLFLTRSRTRKIDTDIRSVAAASRVAVELIKGDSMLFEISDRIGKYDLIFIDGGHTAEIIENDTSLALDMLATGGCIIWHDYGSQVHTEVTKYLDNISSERDLFSIGSTSLVFFTENENLLAALSNYSGSV